MFSCNHPIDVAPILQSALFEQLETAVLTSATLAVAEALSTCGGGWDSSMSASWCCLRTLTIRSRRSSTFRPICRTRALRNLPPKQRTGSSPARDHARPGVRAVHQLRADERGLPAALGELEFPMLLQGTLPRARARGIPTYAARGAVRDLIVSGREWTCRDSSSVA